VQFTDEIGVADGLFSLVELFLEGVVIVDPGLLSDGLQCKHMPGELLLVFVFLLEIGSEGGPGLLEEKVEVIPIYVALSTCLEYVFGALLRDKLLQKNLF